MSPRIMHSCSSVNFFLTPPEVVWARGLTYEEGEFTTLNSTTPSLDVIRWCGNNGFVLLPTPEATWLAIRMGVVPGSVCQPLVEQLFLLSSDERVPTADEFLWALEVYQEAWGVNPMPRGAKVRTSTVSPSGQRAIVSSSGRDGFLVEYQDDCYRSPFLGIASALLGSVLLSGKLPDQVEVLL